MRNYTARNLMRDGMKLGDPVLFYHSNADPTGVVGLARVAREAYPDIHALDPKSKYYDEGATPENPRWVMVDLAWVETFPRILTLEELKGNPALARMELTRKGSRLSVQPVSAEHFAHVMALTKA